MVPGRIGVTVGATTTSDADAIRSRLLYKLGIYDPNFTNASIYHKHRMMKYEGNKNKKQTRYRRPLSASPEEPENQDLKSRLLPVPCLVPIKFGEDSHSQDGTLDDPHLMPSDTSLDGSISKSPSTTRETTVAFHPLVTVTPILTHQSYSSRANARLYVPQHELAAAVARNTREFTYEGWDWRNVIEEEGMYVCPANGEYIHPAHVMGRVVNPYL